MQAALRDTGAMPGEAAGENEGFSHEVEPQTLRYVADDEPGIGRKRAGRGFFYVKPDGKKVTEVADLARFRSLAIPPAWEDVWICLYANGHLQATGRDARGRKQYRYHPEFRQQRDEVKYERLLGFAHVLPKIRAAVANHMGLRGLPKEKVLATVVHLLEITLIRIGNADYAKQNKSYGLTTLRNSHVRIEGTNLRFQFKGKSGKTWRLQISDRRIAKLVRSCQELPGQQLFQYLDEDGKQQGVASSDVNAYLLEISGATVTAKDFRTWAGTVAAAQALHEIGAAETKTAARKNMRRIIERVAAKLGNTVAICRQCYVHPQILDAYMAGELTLGTARCKGDAPHGLSAEERAVMLFLKSRKQTA
ncbi:MAG TPA: DNA topoisomerase IB [Parvibaculum sp.]